MRVVIIGATGHIGSYLVPRLVNAGHEVLAVSRGLRQPYHDSLAWRHVQHVGIDRAAAEADRTFGTAIATLSPDVVIDLICFTLDSAAHLVDALRGRVELFLHCGTLWVHGVPKSRPYDETALREPFGEYGIRKAQIERFLLEAAGGGFPASVLHPGHITGAGWVPVNPAGNLDLAVFARLAQGDRVALPDGGMATLQHVHADDVAQAFELALAQPVAAVGQAFHVAAREPVTMTDYAKSASSWFGRDACLEYLPWDQWRTTVTEQAASITHDHILHSPAASIAKAEALLGFKPMYSAVDAAREAVNWLLDSKALMLSESARRVE